MAMSSRMRRQVFKHRAAKKVPLPSFIAIGVAAVLLTILGHDVLFPESGFRSSGRSKILPGGRLRVRSVEEISENEDPFATGVVSKSMKVEEKGVQTAGGGSADKEFESFHSEADSSEDGDTTREAGKESKEADELNSESQQESNINDSLSLPETETVATNVDGSESQNNSDNSNSAEDDEIQVGAEAQSHAEEGAGDQTGDHDKPEKGSGEEAAIEGSADETNKETTGEAGAELGEETTSENAEKAEEGGTKEAENAVLEGKETLSDDSESEIPDKQEDSEGSGEAVDTDLAEEASKNPQKTAQKEADISDLVDNVREDAAAGEDKRSGESQVEIQEKIAGKEGDSGDVQTEGKEAEGAEKDGASGGDDRGTEGASKEEQGLGEVSRVKGRGDATEDYYAEKRGKGERGQENSSESYVRSVEGKRSEAESEEEVEEKERVHEEESHGGELKLEDRRNIEGAHAGVEDGEKMEEVEQRGERREGGKQEQEAGEGDGTDAKSTRLSFKAEEDSSKAGGLEEAQAGALEEGSEKEGSAGGEEEGGKKEGGSREYSEEKEEVKSSGLGERSEPESTSSDMNAGLRVNSTEGGQDLTVDNWISAEGSEGVSAQNGSSRAVGEEQSAGGAEGKQTGGSEKVEALAQGSERKNLTGSVGEAEEAGIGGNSTEMVVLDREEIQQEKSDGTEQEGQGEEARGEKGVQEGSGGAKEGEKKVNPLPVDVPDLVDSDLLGDPKEANPIQGGKYEGGISQDLQHPEKDKAHKKGSKKKHKKEKAAFCEPGFIRVVKGLVGPEFSPRFANFSTKYVEEERVPRNVTSWKPRFGGHQTLIQREYSYRARDARIHCGFVKPPSGRRFLNSTGFEIDGEDQRYMDECTLVVASAIFGDWDHLRAPLKNRMSSWTKKTVCFVMFLDEKSSRGLSEDGYVPDGDNKVGLWKLVTIRNLPYRDNRKTGKVPKLILHRLFPNARYSIWVDSKLRLQADPLMIWEKYLWRGGSEYAISQHYDRSCVWEEVDRNKELNKYNHTVIDQQFEFYKQDGLTKFDESNPKKPLPSNVPEGSFIVRAHTPMSNLFSCLWFNEVDRFTSRDQLSFFYVFQKLTRINRHPFYLTMFPDCERRAMLKLFKHKSEETVQKDTRKPEEIERDRIRSEEELMRLASEATQYND